MSDAANTPTPSTGKPTGEKERVLLDPDDVYKILEQNVRAYIPDQAKIDLLHQAYRFASECHKHQIRKSGEPYITHPLEVANILTSLRLDHASLIAAILHDVVEDTNATLEDIEKLFGKSVSELVDGLTKIGKIKFRSKQERLAENFRKMVLAMANDLRVILVKLADRLHNMRTLDTLSIEKRQRIAQETLDIYAPLANRLGIYNIKSELEDLCLRQLKNDIYRQIAKKVSAKKAQRQAYIDEVRSILETELRKYQFVNLKVYGRPKHFYSIYKKMIDRELEFEDVNDLFAFRIVVDSVKDCYEALGVVHAMWKPMPGRFKDYIAMPKANMYQSLHTTVIRPNGEPIELQIRTHEMHQTCEFGVAAHWAYKEKPPQEGRDQNLNKFSWLRQIMEWQTELKDPDEFLEAVKIDLFEEEIFVFTPKGDVIQLPTGATALDFAFGVHTGVGQTCVGAKINGKMVPIKKGLKSGDIVEIMTSANQKPSKDWLNFVTTSKARNKIRSYLRSEQRQRGRELGRQLLATELQTRGIDLEKLEKNNDTQSIAIAAKENNYEDALINIGYGRHDPKEIVQKVYPQLDPPKRISEEVTEQESKSQANKAKKSKDAQGVIVSGIEGMLISYGRCCSPLPGEDIVGFITRGRGVTIHRTSCPRALDMDPARRVDTTWASSAGMQAGGLHLAYLRVAAHDRPGVLAEVTGAISSCGANIRKAQIRVNPDTMGVLDFEMSLQSLTQLQAIIRKVESIPAVVTVERRSTQKLEKGE